MKNSTNKTNKIITKTNKHNITQKHKKKTFSKPPFPIDVVYTWKGEDISDDPRLSYNFELKYSLRSIEMYLPWINKIYILMNNKMQPSWIKENDKIIIVEHLDTFPSAKYLPNTNSNAIETTIANIKDLSEHYIYFNDDLFIGRKAKYTEFFTPNGKAIVHDYITKNTTSILKDNKKNKLNIKFPLSYDDIHKHIPVPQIKSLVLDFNKKYADYIDWIRMTKKRKDKGFDICEKNNLNSPCQQVHYPIYKYMYLKNKATVTNHTNNLVYIPNIDPDFSKKLKKLLHDKPLFFCINDAETDIKKREKLPKIMLKFFNAYYPKKASFEK